MAVDYNRGMKTTGTNIFARFIFFGAIITALALFACGCVEGYDDGYDANEPAPQQEGTPNSESAIAQQGEAQSETGALDSAQPTDIDEVTVDENATYTSKDEVALYIHTYGHLPPNFISKTKAKKAGWVASEGNLDEVCPGMSIGGSQFYNDDGLLPDKAGRTWTECDINYHGGYRGSERIVFSNDGLIYYTKDHYSTFERLY